MWELVKAGGWLMLPLVLCSIFTVAISLERFIRLKKSTILPKDLLLNPAQAYKWFCLNLNKIRIYRQRH